ncbi:hypothetical protein [Candidatus Chlorohelix sp.]|uniref:hypothetical protein n=1 Tax=Candidatus Chlorohelix sp. TaxID=3139201 RepID=UPI00302E3A14
MFEQPLLPLDGVISKEGTAYKLRSGGYRPKPEVELVIIRLVFGAEESQLKTFWWLARHEHTTEEVAGGRLMVTNMRDAVAAARHLIRQNFRISRTREETYAEPEISLEEWGLRYMDLLARYAIPTGEPPQSEEYRQSALF